MSVRRARRTLWCAVTIASLTLSACGEEAPVERPRHAEARSPSHAEPATDQPAGGTETVTERTEGSFYSLALPEGAARAQTASTDIIDAVYVLSPEERVSVTIFRPMPAQHDLDAWTDAAERILDGMASRHDAARLGDVDARLAVFPGELRWTAVADGRGLLVKCFAEEPEDEAWMHARCDDVIASLRLSHPVQ